MNQNGRLSIMEDSFLTPEEMDLQARKPLTGYPIIVRVSVPDQNGQKLMKFNSNDSTEDIMKRVAKRMYVDKMEEYALYVPPQPGINIKEEVQLAPGKKPFQLYTMNQGNGQLEFKKKPEYRREEPKEEPLELSSSPRGSVIFRHSRASTKVEKKRRSIGLSNDPAEGVATFSITANMKNIRARLTKFFQSRPSQDSLISKKVLLQEVHEEKAPPLRLDVVKACTEYIEQYCMKSEGIYRISGQLSEIRSLVRSFSSDKVSFENVTSNHTVSSALKTYLREQVHPIIPFENYDPFIASVRDFTEAEERIPEIKKALKSLPPESFEVFRHLCKHLFVVASHKEENKMTSNNLAIVMGPNLLRPRIEILGADLFSENQLKVTLMKTCIDHYESIFEESEESQNFFSD